MIFHNQALGLSFSFGDLTDGEQAHQAGIEKSETDESEYRYIVLSNQMQVLLISDSEADKAAASLDVFVGSSDDPLNRQGLAHFLEHMLFLGTDKYPNPDEYQSYISQHGGQHNAYTSFEHTNYFFDINPASFELALDRFARFFVAPIFNAEYVNREIKAVHSEYMARIKNDYRRQRDVFSQAVNPNHPAAKFSVGNLNTLSDNKNSAVRDDLLAFYSKHYSANRMALVVLSPQTLDELELMIRGKFEEVSNHKIPKLKHEKQLFEADSLPLLLSLQPVQELRELVVTIPLPAMRDYYREKPMRYIANLIGDEGKGSLLSLLKEKGWAEALSAGEGLSDVSGSSFDIMVGLTLEGASNWKQVAGLIFQAIELISQKGLEKWRWLEQSALADTAFRYKELGSPIHRVSRLAKQLHDYPPKEVMRGPYLNNHYDSELIASILKMMTPDNALVTLMAPEATTEKISMLYQVPYKMERLPDIKGMEIGESLELPLENKFVPGNFEMKRSVKELSAGNPTLLSDTDDYRLWHYLDSHYQVPKAQFYASVKTRAIKSVSEAAMAELYLSLVNERLNEHNYPATLAGLNYGIYRQADGVGFFVSGFDDKMPFLVKEVVEGLLAPIYKRKKIKQQEDENTKSVDVLLERLRRELIRTWRNNEKNSPYKQLLSKTSTLLDPRSWAPEQLADALSNFNKNRFVDFVDQLYKGSTIEFFVSGNIDSFDAKLIASDVAQYFKGKTYDDWLAQEVFKVSAGEKLQIHLAMDHDDFAILRYYQGRSDSVKEAAGMILLKQLISSDFFHELRTEQQLGYIVAVVDRTVDRVPGIGLLVQSPKATIPELEKSIDDFLLSFFRKLKVMSREDFQRHKEAVLVRLREKPKSLAEHSSRLWESINMRDYSFDHRDALMLAVKQLTYAEVFGLYDFLVIRSGYSLQLDNTTGAMFSEQQFKKDRNIFSLPDSTLNLHE